MGVRSRRYEITVAGRAAGMLRAASDGGTVRVGPGTRALRAGLPDRAGLWGLVRPVMGLGLDVAGLHLVTRGSW